jgi:CubicO group peptidase (beta-lactamase class C family)
MNMKVRSYKGFGVPPIRLVIAVLAIVAVISATVWLWPAVKTSSPNVPAPDYWPTNGWRTAAPETHGFDSAITAHGLRAIRQDGTRVHSLMVVSEGELILDAYFYPYDGSTLHDQASVTKSVMTTLIGIAADQGKLDLDAPMLSFFPGRAIANLDTRKERITVRHLLSNTAGMECIHHPDEPTNRAMHASPDWIQFTLDLPMVAEPGTTFAYCSPGMHLLSAILQEATGMTTLEFARANLFGPLGIQDVQWPPDPQGITNGHGELYLYPRDAAKLGFLWLHGGEWDGQQIVSHEWVRAASQSQIATGADYSEDYGYGMWVARPDEEPHYFAADGRGGQRVVIVPSMNLIIVTTGGGFAFDNAVKYLVEALGEGNPLPDNAAGVADLEKALAEVVLPPVAQPVPPLPEIARAISGHTYIFDDNPYRLASLHMEFDQSAEARLHMTYYGDMADRAGTVGLDGRYRFSEASDGPAEKFLVGLRGAWSDTQTFVLDYNQVASPNAMMLRVHFDGERVLLEGPGADWEGTVSIEGWQE